MTPNRSAQAAAATFRKARGYVAEAALKERLAAHERCPILRRHFTLDGAMLRRAAGNLRHGHPPVAAWDGENNRA